MLVHCEKKIVLAIGHGFNITVINKVNKQV